jgi:hypothetical protein
MYVSEVNQNLKIISFDVVQNDTINMILNDGRSNLKYGKWIFYFENGVKKSEGKFSLELNRVCGNGGPYIPSYREIRVGKWQYWNEQGEPRTDLIGEEIPCQGTYRHLGEDGRIFSEGLYGDAGVVITGKMYSYVPATGELYQTIVIQDGKIVRVDKK